MKGNLRGQFNL